MSVKQSTVKDILDLAKSEASPALKSVLPDVQDGNVGQLRAYGDILNSNPSWRNEFLGIVKRIAYQVIKSKFWENPLEFLFKSQDYGYAIDEVFVNIAKPLAYDPFGEGEKLWERVMPDIREKMHVLNIQTHVDQTLYLAAFKQSFFSWDGVSDMISKIVTSMYSGMNEAIYQAAKYCLVYAVVKGGIGSMKIDDTSTNPKDATTKLLALSDKFKFITDKYNAAGVSNFSAKGDQYIFVTPEFNATQTVDVFAYMFNVAESKVDMRRIVVDDFYSFDYDKLNNMFIGGVPHIFTDAEIELLKHVPAIIADKDFLFLYKNTTEFTEKFNDLKMYWNYRFHWWGTISFSPFENAIALYDGSDTMGSASGISSPYADGDIVKVGRDNLFKVLPARADGVLLENSATTYTVSGNALVPKEGYPGWYQAVNEKGQQSTITYSYTNSPSGTKITKTVTVVTI